MRTVAVRKKENRQLTQTAYTAAKPMDQLLRAIEESWGWIGLKPVEVVGENDWGNLIIEDEDGRYWRLVPEDLKCTVVANDRAELDRLSADQEFLRDWYMMDLTEAARQAIGELKDGRKYCLAVPGPLGGKYEVSNVKTLVLEEVIRFSGALSRQIRDLPDGAEIELKVVD